MPHLLLIEPDYLLADIYRQALESGGYKVTICRGAQAAIMTANKLMPDIVVLELQLTKHSGIEFLYEFRSYPEWQGVPVIVLSQVPPPEFNGSYHLLRDELGVVSYNYKPQTSLGKLLTAVREAAPITA